MAGSEARDWSLVLDIVWNCDRAAEFIQGLDLDGFEASILHQYAVIRCVAIVGEAAGKLSPGFRASLPDIPWQAITGMRHIVVHDYERVDLRRLWMTVTTEMPRLSKRLRPLVPPDTDP